jgi:undecaprenyl-diphosphatase
VMATTLDRTSRREHFAIWSAVGLVPVVVLGVGLIIVVTLVASQWSPLKDLDQTSVDVLNAVVNDKPKLVQSLDVLTTLGGFNTSVLILVTLTAALLIRRETELALFVTITGLGIAVLTFGTKELVERVRPVFEVPVSNVGGHSFPSGHSLAATVTYGVLLLVFLPLVHPRWRGTAIGVVAAVVMIVGVTRIALGAHFPSDVVGGWLMGVLWLVVTTAAFRRWEEPEDERRPVAEGLPAQDGEALEPANVPGRWSRRGHPVATLLVVAVLLWGFLAGVGSLIVRSATVQRADREFISWLAGLRSDWVSALADALGSAGSTTGVPAVVVVSLPVALALTRRWAAGLLLLVAAFGASTVFFASSEVVGRKRPIDDLGSAAVAATGESIPTSSFPSGHVAASVAVYGALALLFMVWSRSRLRYAAPVVAALIVAGVAFSRMYHGAHYPTDVLASLVYGSCWLTACWLVLRPGVVTPAVTRRRRTLRHPAQQPSTKPSSNNTQARGR